MSFPWECLYFRFKRNMLFMSVIFHVEMHFTASCFSYQFCRNFPATINTATKFNMYHICALNCNVQKINKCTLWFSIYYKYINSLCKQKASLHDWTEISKVLVGWSHSRWTLLWRQSEKVNNLHHMGTGTVNLLQHSIVCQNLTGRF